MGLNLLGNETVGTIDSNVLEDLGVIELLKRIFDDKEVNELIDLIVKIPTREGIQLRQSILTDVLHDQNNLFFKISLDLMQLEKYYTLYEEEQLDIKYAFFLKLMEEYQQLLMNGYDRLSNLTLSSPKLIELRDSLNQFIHDTAFKQLMTDIQLIKSSINGIYSMNIQKVPEQILIYKQEQTSLYEQLIHICLQLQIPIKKETYDVKNQKLHPSYLSGLTKLNQPEFKLLKQFHDQYSDFFNTDLLTLRSQVDFYLRLKRFYQYLDEHHVTYCRPEISQEHAIHLEDCIDLTLLTKVDSIISNDYKLNDLKSIHLITGVNSGGKTSYLKAFGICYLLFLVGGYVPGTKASLYPVKHFYTHFPNNEEYEVGNGRLSDEILRIDGMRKHFNPNCLVILNETYSSTFEEKALKLSFSLIDEFIHKHVFCLYVTHQHKLFEQVTNESVIRMSPTVDEHANNRRLYKIKPTDKGIKSYTHDILLQYGLTKHQLEQEDKNEI